MLDGDGSVDDDTGATGTIGQLDKRLKNQLRHIKCIK